MLAYAYHIFVDIEHMIVFAISYSINSIYSYLMSLITVDDFTMLGWFPFRSIAILNYNIYHIIMLFKKLPTPAQIKELLYDKAVLLTLNFYERWLLPPS